MISINSSTQVLAFLPQNTWTEVILLSSMSNNNDVYLVTTEDRVKKKLEDMQKMSMQISTYEQITDFKPLKMVAVEVEGKWHRGKLLSFNEFKSNNTRIELLDVGSVFETKLQNVLVLPYYFMYDPLVLPVKFKNFTPKTKTLSIKPILSESELHECVLVDVNYRNGIEIEDSLIKEQCLNKTNGLSSISDSSVSSVKNVTNGLVNDALGSYLSNSFRRGSCQSWQKPKDIPLKNGDCCIVTFIENFSNVYVGKAVKQEKDNIDITVKTALCKDKIPMCNPDMGDIVKVFSSEYNGLFRAKILKNNNNGNYNVFYIDYGNIETVSLNDIYELSDELKKEPGLAIQIGLVGLNDIPFTKKIKDEFSDFIEDRKPFIIEFDDTSKNCLKNVKLKDIENELYIYNYVMKWLSKDPDSKEPIQTIENNTTTDDHNINQSNNLKNNDTVYLKHFEDMDSVYIVKDAILFNNIMLSVQDKSFVCKTNFNVGDIVKVHSTSCSYRAKINKIYDTSISVINIDFGYSDIVQKDFIYELPSELKKIPGLALKVGIKKPIIKKTHALIEFIRETEKIPLYLEYDINREITLRRKDNSENIFDEFLKTADHSIICNGILKRSEQDQISNKKNECLTKDFKYISLENGDYCMISYFEDFKNIYICKAVKNSSNDGPDYVMHNDVTVLKTLSCQDRKTKTNIAIGDIVKVFSSSYKGFYRAKILSIKNDDEFYVQYIDFGNTEVVKSKDIFELSDELKKENTLLPLKVSIEVPPNAKSSTEIKEMFTNLIDNYVVLLIEYKTKSNDRLENVLLKELNSGKSINVEVLKLLPVEKVLLKNGDSCIISHFEDLDCIYVSSNPFSSENALMLDEIMNGPDRVTKTNPVIGDIVKVYSSEFNDLFRGKILDIVNNSDFHVFYIDFGNTEVVKSKDIFELSDSLKIKPGLAIKVGINIPNNIQKNEEITKMFLSIALSSELLSIEFDESSEDGLKNCILKIPSSGLIINNEVLKLLPIQSSIALEKAGNHDLKNEEHTVIPDEPTHKIKPELLKNGDLVFLRYFHDSSSVFISQGSDEHSNRYNYVTEKTFLDRSKNKKVNIQIGDIVKAMYDGDMYRAEICKQLDRDHFYISFIDYGNEKISHVDDIFELSDELKKIPGLCFKVGLKGSPKIEKTKDVLEYLENLESEPLHLEYDADNPNGLKEVNLKRKNNCDIIDELFKIVDKPSNVKEESVQNMIENGIDLINSSESEAISSMELKSGDTVYCSYFEDFNHIYLCKGSEKNTLLKNNLIIDSSKIEEMDVKNNPKFEDIVRVKFNDKIYRAKVLNKCRDTYTVFLIDMGKKINVMADNIFELPIDFKHIPGLAIKVGLKGTTDVKITKTVEEYFQSLCFNNEAVPLTLTYDDDNFNCLNEVHLKNLSDGHDIVQDLLKLCNTSDDLNNKVKPFLQYSNSNGSSVQKYKIGDHFEFLSGNNVDNIYIRHIKLYEDNKHILEQLKEEKRENLKPTTPKPNDIIIVYSSKYDGLYRAKVLGSNMDEKFKCSLIDFSYLDIIPSKNMYALPIDFSINKIPIMVHRVTLAGMTKVNNNCNVNSYLSSLIGKTFVLEYETTVVPWYKQVVLKELKTGVSINSEIKKIISVDSSPISQQRRLERKIIMIEKKESELEKISHPIKSGSSVHIRHFDNFNSIFIQDASYEGIENFDSLNKLLFKMYKSVSKSPKEVINSGDKVCVRSSVHMLVLTRALILDKIGDDYSVFCLDYGNIELINPDDIFDYPKEVEKYKDFAIKVKLQNMPTITTKSEKQVIKDYFKKKFIVTNSVLIIEFNEFNPKGLDDIILRTQYYQKDIADEIRALLNAPPLNIKTAGQSAEQQSSPNVMYPYPARRHNNVLK